MRGELANNDGPSDLFLSVNHAFQSKGNWKKSFIAGVKLPFNEADLGEDGYSLPMPYQSSLGTIDLVVGINLNRKNFGASLALQQPLKAKNRNNFLPETFPPEQLPDMIPETVLSKYAPTNEFERKGDLVGRVSYKIFSNDRFSIRPSLLGIYHLADDTYLDGDKDRQPILNSQGLTLNSNVFIGYIFNNGNGLEFSFGAPFKVRKKRPDGLTRSYVASLEYRLLF